MPGSPNRSVAVVSALLTVLVLGGGLLGVAFRNGWLRPASDALSSDAVSATAEPAAGRNDGVAPGPVAKSSSTIPAQGGGAGEVDVYRQKLDEAYRALDEAYAQIRSLQTAQPLLANNRERGERSGERDGDDDRRERRPRRADSDHD